MPIALLTEPGTVAKFDAILHLGWIRVRCPLLPSKEQVPNKRQICHCFKTFWTLVPARVIPRSSSFFRRRPFTETQSFQLSKKRRALRWAGMHTPNCWLRKSFEAPAPLRILLDAASCEYQMFSVRLPDRRGRRASFLAFAGRFTRKRRCPSGATEAIRKITFSWQHFFSTRCRRLSRAVLTGTFNVASEQSLSSTKSSPSLRDSPAKTLRSTHCPAFCWDVARSYISARKLRVATGWCARYNPEEAIRQMTEAPKLLAALGSVHEFLIKMKAETRQRAAKKVFASLS